MRSSTLRTQIVLATLLAVVPVLVYAAVLLTRLQNEEREAAGAALLHTARALASAVDREIETTIVAMQVLGTASALQRGDLRDFYAMAAEARRLRPAWQSVFLADGEGRELLSLLRPFGAPLPVLSEDPDIRAVLDTGRVVVSDLRTGQVSGKRIVRVAVPVELDGRLRYVLAATIPPEAFGAILARQRLVHDGVAAVLDRAGVVVARSRDPERWVGQQAPSTLARLVTGSEGRYESRTFEGTPVYGAYARAPRSGFVVAIGIPESLVVAPARRSLAFLLAGGGVLLGAAVAIAFALGARITRPARALSAAVRALGQGHPLPALPATGIREYAGLAETLRRASEAFEQRLLAERGRREAEARVERMGRLQQVADAALRHLGRAELLREITTAVRPALGSDTAAVLLVSGGQLVTAASSGSLSDPAPAPIPVTAGIAGRIAASESGLVIDDLDGEPSRGSGVVEGMRAFVGAPLRVGGRLIGIIHAAARAPGVFGPEDLALLRLVADRIGLALDRADLLAAERAARAEAESATRAKDAFLATLSHELRQPLNSIVGWLRLLRQSDVNAPIRSQALDSIERAAWTQARLVDDLLDLSAITAGKVRLDLRATDIGKTVRSAIDAVRPAAAARRIEITSSVDPGVRPLAGDPDRLHQVIWNLLSNAIRFSAEGGVITVRVERTPSGVTLTVQDGGRGIAPELLPHVFEPFRQGEGRAGTLGLGLAIVKHLVELHGGAIVASSRGEGTGATFTVSLPAAAPPASPPAPAGDPASRALGGLAVLVVDDDPDARAMLSALLQGFGARVAAVESMRDARAVLRTFDADVVLGDPRMRGEEGWGLVAALQREGRPLPAVALTALTDPAARRRAVGEGFVALLAKPAPPDALVVAIRQAAAARSGT